MRIKQITLLAAGLMTLASVATSCNDFLDCEPLAQITPEKYFYSEQDLAAYTIAQYNFTTYLNFSISPITNDNNTDDMAGTDGSLALWSKGDKKTPASGGAWDFSNIRKANYFFEQVLPKYEAGQISGDINMVKHYIGEMYFLRARDYFSRLQSLGDFPIVTTPLPDEQGVLTEASKREPRNKVARFILEDLDKAIEFMQPSTSNGKTRLTRNVALLLKSRVALYEATWLKYHKGTNRVPGGPGWPGADAEWNKGFTIDLDSEVDFFLSQAMEAAAAVADAVSLTENSGVYNPQTSGTGWNPYFEMFSAESMENIPEVLFWRSYSAANGVTHAVGTYLSRGGGNTGFTRSMVETFLMKNGKPIYADGSGYHGDLTIEDVKADRDDRLNLFMAAPSDVMRLNPHMTYVAPEILKNDAEKCTTGYPIRKFLSYDVGQIGSGAGAINTYGCMLYRAAEAYLNYIEACYERTNSLDSKALNYWKALRNRAGVSDDIQATVAATDVARENDWAKYSGDELINPTLYSIRRERRNELMGEGFRMMDLKRWRSLDMVKNAQIEGFNLWGGELEKLYANANGTSKLIPEGTAGKRANVSSKTNSTYLRLNQIVKNNNQLYDGLNWYDANYLEPIAAIHFTTTADDPDHVETSLIYQNPGWSRIANQPAE